MRAAANGTSHVFRPSYEKHRATNPETPAAAAANPSRLCARNVATPPSSAEAFGAPHFPRSYTSTFVPMPSNKCPCSNENAPTRSRVSIVASRDALFAFASRIVIARGFARRATHSSHARSTSTTVPTNTPGAFAHAPATVRPSPDHAKPSVEPSAVLEVVARDHPAPSHSQTAS